MRTIRYELHYYNLYQIIYLPVKENPLIMYWYGNLFTGKSTMDCYSLSIKGSDHSSRTVLDYLARYIHRVAIANSRILSVDNGNVTFRYKDSKRGAYIRTMTVNAEELIRRFLQHVLPAGVHKVRYYGLWSPSNRKKLLELQRTLTQSENDEQERLEEDMDMEVSAPVGSRQCPHCQKGTLVWIGSLFRQGRAPP